MKTIKAIFCMLCAGVILLPSLGMLWAPTNQTTENRELAPFPPARIETGFNANYLPELGTYFEDHFAYKNEMITANAKLKSVFGVSSSPTVIMGTNGWLYYSGTLNDYQGKNLITQKTAQNIAFNISLLQQYCETNGAKFAITIPPNKNSIYPGNMPYYYGLQAENNTSDLLADSFKSQNVSYVNAFGILQNSSQNDLYYKSDTHWTETGALRVTSELMEQLGKYSAATRLNSITASATSSNVGDLSKMLYPSEPSSDEEAIYDGNLHWTLLFGENTTDIKKSLWLEAEGEGDGVLYMFRDSFAKNMVPFLSSSFSQSYYDWNTPWDMTQILKYKPSAVVCERVERNIWELGVAPAIMPAPRIDLKLSKAPAGKQDLSSDTSKISISEMNDMYVIEGCLPTEYANASTEDIYVALEAAGHTTYYVPFRVSIDENEYGYRAYIDKSEIENPASASLVCAYQNDFVCIQRQSFALNAAKE